MEKVLKQFSVSLDTKRSTSNRDFEVVHGDNGNVLEITLTDDGQPVDLSESFILAVFSKSDGKTAAQDNHGNGITLDEEQAGKLYIELYTTSFAPGLVECELQVYSGEGQRTLATTAKFNFMCRLGIANNAVITETDEWPVLVQMLDRVVGVEDELHLLNDETAQAATEAHTAANRANEAGEYAEEVSDEIKANEAQRLTSENLRIGAETGRINAESTRSTSEQGRITAEQARAEHEQQRIDDELLRQGAEITRQDSESIRTSSEETRSIAETERLAAESLRVTKEQLRQQTETARVLAERSREDFVYGLQASAQNLPHGSEATAQIIPTGSSAMMQFGIPQPRDGINGNDGKDGKDGKDAVNVSVDGMFYMYVTDEGELHMVVPDYMETNPFHINDNGELIYTI